MDFNPLQAAVRSLLNHAPAMNWTVQGFGMLRTYLDPDKRFRLNIWHQDLMVPGVSVIHDHPWHFKSWIIAGRFINQRYIQCSADAKLLSPVKRLSYMTIKTGEGGGPAGSIQDMYVTPLRKEEYFAGDTYAQQASEIHESDYINGCVTLNDRTRVGTGEHARVFWPYGQEWVDAEPRAATVVEIMGACQAALKLFP